MNRNEAKDYIKDQLPDYLNDKGINISSPFRCLNPEHDDRHPSMSYDRKRNKAHCFSCNADYDTLDLIALDYGTDAAGAFLKAYELYGITIDGGGEYQNPIESERNTQPGLHNQQAATKTTQPDLHNTNKVSSIALARYLDDCRQRLDQTNYLANRGISTELAERFNLGYDPQYTAGGSHKPWPAVIIPTSETTFVARNTDPRAAKGDRYRKNGGNQLFNAAALDTATKPVVIVEGELDALSIMQAGGEAVALGSVENVNQLQSYLSHHKPEHLLVIALDNDDRGQHASDQLKTWLTSKGIAFQAMNVAGDYKDANEALVKNPAFFKAGIKVVNESEERIREHEKEAYLKTSSANQLQKFVDGIEQSKTRGYFPTGFNNLDKLLDGGLYAGLYIVGAISSLGKTTFTLQAADQIAAQEQDVLIFSLEMAEEELIAKSVSRNTLLADLDTYKETKHAKSTRGILTGSRYDHYSKQEREIIIAGIQRYAKYADHIFISVGVGSIGIEQIKSAVKKHTELTGRRPVVLIDYLQILAPADPRSTDKQNTDKVVLELKRLSRDYDVPVVGISSFNRENYTAPVSMTSFKESGAIEYSSDVLLGIQYEGMDYQEGETEKARDKRVRGLINENLQTAKQGGGQHLEIKVLKNRNGSKGSSLIDFYPVFNYFTETSIATQRTPQQQEGGWTKAKSTYNGKPKLREPDAIGEDGTPMWTSEGNAKARTEGALFVTDYSGIETTKDGWTKAKSTRKEGK